MLEIDLKAPAKSASESFLAAASAAAGTVPALPFASLPALAGQAWPLKTQRRMQMIRHSLPRPTSEIFLVMNSTRLEQSRRGGPFDRLTGQGTEKTSIVVLLNGHKTRFSN